MKEKSKMKRLKQQFIYQVENIHKNAEDVYKTLCVINAYCQTNLQSEKI